MSDDLYRLMAIVHPQPWCWYCGRDAADAPAGWGGPWLIERAHIVSNPRREDRRAVILLCSLCHRLQHGLEISLVDVTPPAPLDVPGMLWLKMHFDRYHYDRRFLQSCSIGRLPCAKRPKMSARKEYETRKGRLCV